MKPTTTITRMRSVYGIIASCVSIIALCIAAPTNAVNYVEGKHYTRLAVKQNTPAVGDGKVEVIEMFSYGCGFCYRYDPLLKAWYKENSDKVKLKLMPVIWEIKTRYYAHVFYTAQALNILDKTHSLIFEEVLGGRNTFASQGRAYKFFSKFGVEEEIFNKAWTSFLTSSAVKRSERALAAYEVAGTPTLIVNGEYSISPGPDVSHQQTIEVASSLIDRIISERGGR